jgi:serine protease
VRLEMMFRGVKALEEIVKPHGRSWFIAPLLALFVACPQPVPPKAYNVVAVQPSPVAPGATVTVYGTLPVGAALEFDTQPSPSVPVADGLSFTVPERAVAGERGIVVRGDGAKLEASVTVQPRLDRASLTGSTLSLEGAGWDATSDVRAIVNTLEVKPSLNGARLEVALGANAAFGAISVSVRVGGQSSNAVTLSREAGAVTGFVRLPASAPLMARVSTQSLNLQKPISSLLFETDPGSLPTALEVTRLEPLGVWRAHFASPLEANTALKSLQARGVTARFELNVPPSDGVTALDAPAPLSSGAGQWFLERQGIPAAWAVSRGAGIVVAVVDMGVRLDHPDLKANLLPGYDFVDGDNDPSPVSSSEGHGTHVAGLVAAHGLATGVAPDARVLPVRVLNAQGGDESAVALGILWAANLIPTNPNPHKADVVNLSLGAGAYSSLIADAVTRAQTSGVIVVAAAGNDGSATVSYPAALPGVIAVTALAGPVTPYAPFYASHGPGTWLTAYGGDSSADQDGNGVNDGILSTDNTPSGYGLRMGTSMACPQVAGLVALALSSGTPRGLARDTLARGATDLGAWGFDPRYGWGLISGRIALPFAPRAYVLAVPSSSSGTGSSLPIRAWTPVSADGTYSLSNLEPGVTYAILSASDANGNGVVGEPGELLSQSLPVTAAARVATALEDLTLQPAPSGAALTLEVSK